jgi:uncharacterized protein (TIGR03435 family)
MTRWTVFFSLFALLTAPASRAQSTSPAFDVASVKVNPNCQFGTGRAAISPRNLALPCVSLRALIRIAYGDMLVAGGFGARRMEVQGGPGWLDTERYDVLAKSEGTTVQSAAPMLQTLIEERFKVKVHKEARDTSVYTLTVAHGGPKLQPTKEGSCIPIDLNNLPTPHKPGEPVPRHCRSRGETLGELNRTPPRYNRTVLLRQEEPARGLRTIPFILGAVLALASFAFFAWGMAHYWAPYSPGSPHRAPSPFFRYFSYLWLLDPALRIWRKHKSKTDNGWWPKRNSYPAPPESDNIGATQPHVSESANNLPQR